MWLKFEVYYISLFSFLIMSPPIAIGANQLSYRPEMSVSVSVSVGVGVGFKFANAKLKKIVL